MLLTRAEHMVRADDHRLTSGLAWRISQSSRKRELSGQSLAVLRGWAGQPPPSASAHCPCPKLWNDGRRGGEEREVPKVTHGD